MMYVAIEAILDRERSEDGRLYIECKRVNGLYISVSLSPSSPSSPPKRRLGRKNLSRHTRQTGVMVTG